MAYPPGRGDRTLGFCYLYIVSKIPLQTLKKADVYHGLRLRPPVILDNSCTQDLRANSR
ncbi:MAG: hypothetical protein V7K88_03110 [Nostoc sp.]|uniref:hypothetical protein n=1 Tax=Nostoc sp. TaxID=1180 RepID=UPI002FFC4232